MPVCFSAQSHPVVLGHMSGLRLDQVLLFLGAVIAPISRFSAAGKIRRDQRPICPFYNVSCNIHLVLRFLLGETRDLFLV